MRLWRRFRGGHWERWHIDSPVNGPVWLTVDRCTAGRSMRPTGL